MLVQVPRHALPLSILRAARPQLPEQQAEAGDGQAFVQIDDEVYPLANTGGWLRIDGSGAADGECAGVLRIDNAGPRWLSLKGRLR